MQFALSFINKVRFIFKSEYNREGEEYIQYKFPIMDDFPEKQGPEIKNLMPNSPTMLCQGSFAAVLPCFEYSFKRLIEKPQMVFCRSAKLHRWRRCEWDKREPSQIRFLLNSPVCNIRWKKSPENYFRWGKNVSLISIYNITGGLCIIEANLAQVGALTYDMNASIKRFWNLNI